MQNYSLESIRKQIIGNDLVFDTPFGERHLLYTDYTASGRGLEFIEEQILNIEKSYANTHTEDDYSGKYMTTLLHQAEAKIKQAVNAGKGGKVIASGSGCTGALKKLQEIIGVYIPPVAREKIYSFMRKSSDVAKGFEGEFAEKLEKDSPVVFIGPYEHHTNELMWREALAEVVVIPFDSEGRIDLNELEKKLTAPEYKKRLKIGSFSAGSNITGILTRVYDIARLCHQHNALVFYDFAAVAPYIEINMNKDREAYFDAIFFSPHKFLGGPATSGILVFNEGIYRTDLPPTTAGGGTVTFVGYDTHDFSNDIETREKAGTPPILQTIKAALVLDLKEKIGIKTIEKIEARYTEYFVDKLKKINNLELLGDVAPEKRVSIISFNIKHLDRILHPKFVTKLMNDLFGIQSRAGCSCAGPYGHALLGIENNTSHKYRNLAIKGNEGIKPGWVRVNIHYTLSKDDVDYLIRVIKFIAQKGHLFLHKYTFNMQRGEWKYIGFEEQVPEFSVDKNFRSKKIPLAKIPGQRRSYIKQAEAIAAELQDEDGIDFIQDEKEIEGLKLFYYAHKT